MQRIEDILFSCPPALRKFNKSACSAVFDMIGCNGVQFAIIRGTVAQAEKFYFYHASASTVLAASATAFTTLPTLTTAATASLNYVVLFEGQTGMKRYLRVKMSTAAASNFTCCFFQGYTNRTIPGSSTLSTTGVTTGAFSSITRPLV